jgi:hypothetical protein
MPFLPNQLLAQRDKMKFTLEEQHRNVPDEDLLADIKRVAALNGNAPSLTWAAYGRDGNFGAETIRKRFGSWNAALAKAGLRAGKRWRIPDEELFRGLEEAWIRLGRQPRRTEMDHPSSAVSKSVYEQRFGTWRKALEAFVTFMNQSDDTPTAVTNQSRPGRKETPREPSLRLRFKVMRRDSFRCVQCGRSPAKDPTVELHVDHKDPWSGNGETTLENLQTLCSKCNLGKSNLMETGANQASEVTARKLAEPQG